MFNDVVGLTGDLNSVMRTCARVHTQGIEPFYGSTTAMTPVEYPNSVCR